ncbi:MAG: ribosome maturation factor RimP [candidate division Zixibacteria bacterium]|nr:ribosome maturation factor RimP [candidate division Zixibacteria bacterium]
MLISEEKLQEMIRGEVQDANLVFVEMQLVRHKGSTILRVFADKPGGITVDDCARLSRRLELVLDNEEVFDKRYLLEVSSPGLDRPLTTEQDFSLKVGETIRLNYTDDVGDRQQLVGKIITAGDNLVKLETDSGQVEKSLDNIVQGKIIL